MLKLENDEPMTEDLGSMLKRWAEEEEPFIEVIEEESEA